MKSFLRKKPSQVAVKARSAFRQRLPKRLKVRALAGACLLPKSTIRHNLSGITALRPFAGNAAVGRTNPSASGTFDDFRLGATFAAVAVPEPSVYACFALGMILLGFLRNRSRVFAAE